MKKIVFTCLLLTISVFCYATREEVVLHPNSPHPNHQMFPIPADKPDVYYDSDTQEIIVDGLGVVDSYDVDIEAVSTGYVLISTEVDGDYDTIDISSLPGDQYMITVTTPYNNTYVGYFYLEEE